MQKILLFIWLLAGQAGLVSADVLVLVHGYASNALSWEHGGVNHVLSKGGWQQVGVPGVYSNDGDNKFYSLELPANAPLLTQTHFLQNFLQRIRKRHGDANIILAGHSVGGVVARLSLLQGNHANVSKLITIASPHLGTPRALQGLQVLDDKPFFCPGPGIAFVKSVLGGDRYQYLRHSRGVLIDLLPQGKGSILDWANRQTHPDIEYHAVIRQGGDELVPAFSQDLNQVPALRGKAKIWVTRASHKLNSNDGLILLRILGQSS